MQSKVTNYDEVVSLIKDGMTIMIGGFGSVGVSKALCDAVLDSGAQNLTIITNDTSYPGSPIAKATGSDQVTKLITTHVGLNPETTERHLAGKLDLELVPQGSLIEKIRCGGGGLGGTLTPTGLGTAIEEGKRIIEIKGKDYILEEALHADLALLKATESDEFGNSFYGGSSKSFNVMMAFAADTVVVDTDKVVKIGELDPHKIETSGILVDYVIEGGKRE